MKRKRPSPSPFRFAHVTIPGPVFAGAVALAFVLALAVVTGRPFVADAQGLKPEPWKPKAPGATSADSTAAASATVQGSAGRGEHPVELPKDVRRAEDLVYQPNVPDSLLPFVPAWVDIQMEEKLSGYQGTLRQGSPERFYPIVLPDQSVHAEVNGGPHGTQLALVLFLPWLGEFVRDPYTTVEVVHRTGDGPEQKAKLPFSPGPVMFSQSFPRPLPVSAPALLTISVPPGRHRVAIKLRDFKAPYVFLLLGQPRPAPLPLVRDS
ncbi:MAG: hypothetical protein ACREOU_05000 [Candidatus Eiseniibacteriota bacterium]